MPDPKRCHRSGKDASVAIPPNLGSTRLSNGECTTDRGLGARKIAFVNWRGGLHHEAQAPSPARQALHLPPLDYRQGTPHLPPERTRVLLLGGRLGKEGVGLPPPQLKSVHASAPPPPAEPRTAVSLGLVSVFS